MKKVLVVEDDALLLRLYQKEIAFRGYKTDTARDGIEGLIRVKKFKPDLILLDLAMPKLDGLGVLDKLKEDPLTSRIPVIVLTNNSRIDNAEIALQKGAVMYLMKGDQTPKEVVEKIEEVLRND